MKTRVNIKYFANDCSQNTPHLGSLPITVIKYLVQLQKSLQLWKNNCAWEEYLEFGISDIFVSKHHNYDITELQHDRNAVSELFDRGLQTAK